MVDSRRSGFESWRPHVLQERFYIHIFIYIVSYISEKERREEGVYFRHNTVIFYILLHSLTGVDSLSSIPTETFKYNDIYKYMYERSVFYGHPEKDDPRLERLDRK